MTGCGSRLNRWLIRCGLVFGVLWGGSTSLGFEVMFDGPVLGGRWGGPFVPQVQHMPTAQTQDGFSVAASGTAIQDTPAGEALKLIEAGEWVKAIQAIESLDDTEDKLVVDERGVLRPLSTMKSALIASMPDEGRSTFRKLNDPAADTRLAEAVEMVALDQRAAALKSIVDSYALCDAAADAAKQLGDIRFEQGRFNEAAAYFRFAAKHPAEKPDDPALMARRLTALSRAGQWNAFNELAEYARFRHPETTIRIAGQDAPLQAFITDLVASRGDQPVQPREHTHGELKLPDSIELEYDVELIDENTRRVLRQQAQNNNLGGIIDQMVAPRIASDGKRLYTLALGSVARLNPETGTELWRSGDMNASVQQLSQRMYHIMGGYHQSLTVHGDTVLAALPGKNSRLHMYLHAIDAETGEVRWSASDILRSNNETVVGDPLVIDDMVYYVSYRSTQDLTLRAVRLDNGIEAGKLALGKVSKGPHMNTPAELSPRLTMGQSHLMVQTNNGALIAVNPTEMSVAWAFTQKIRESGMQMMRRRGIMVANAVARHTGDVIAEGGIVIAKDTRTNQVVAFREYDAALVWSAEADADSTIVHHDSQHVYVLGEELVALDKRTGERVWWTDHPGTRSGAPVFTHDACLVAGNERLCRVDLQTGKLTQYQEDHAGAAALQVVGQQLIGVTDEGITAIRLP
ncbi:MAG: PQQ-binding-like beta-propeller repeat protein [Planctomycetota bacterium]